MAGGMASVVDDTNDSAGASAAKSLDLVVVDILTELASNGYTHHVPLLSNKPKNYNNVQSTPKIYEGVALADPGGAFTAALTDAHACIEAWLATHNTALLSTAMHATTDAVFTHQHCSLRVATTPATLATAPSPPTEAINFCTLQHMIGQLHPQLETHDTQRPLFNTVHEVHCPHDTTATVQPLGAPLVLPSRCRFLMSDIRRANMLVNGARVYQV